MQAKKPKKTQTQLVGSAPFFIGPHHAPLPAAKTLHYPLPLDRHIKPKFLNLQIEQSAPLIVFSDLGVPIEEIAWGGWVNEYQEVDPYDEALINEDIHKLEQLTKK